MGFKRGYDKVVETASRLGPLHCGPDDSPGTNYIKKTLQSEDIVVFTDSVYRDQYKMTRDILNVLEQKWKPVVLESEELKEYKSSIEQILEKITNCAVPPHLFYKQKYYASGRKIHKLFAHGQLENLLGLESTLVH